MKNKILIVLCVISTSVKLFATTSLDVTYKTKNVSIYYFLCKTEMLHFHEIPTNDKYKTIEENFYRFLYLTDTLLKISSKNGTQISFYSEHGIGDLSIGNKRYIFVSPERESEVKASVQDYIPTEDYKNPYFIIPFICKDLELEIPQQKIKNRKLYSLEINLNNKIEFNEPDESNSIFFYPGGDVYYSPCFELNKKNYIGFYYSEKDAMEMKKILREKYYVSSTIKEFPLNFSLINEAYFDCVNFSSQFRS